MAFMLIVIIVLASLLVIASGVWVASGLIAAITAPKNRPTESINRNYPAG